VCISTQVHLLFPQCGHICPCLHGLGRISAISLKTCSVCVCKVIFAPRIAGVYVAQLSLSCIPVDCSLPVTGKLPVMVTLQAVAENPSVEVLVVSLHFFLLIPLAAGRHN